MNKYNLEMNVEALRQAFEADYAEQQGDAAEKIAKTELGKAHFKDITAGQKQAKDGAGINTLFFLLLIGAKIKEKQANRSKAYLVVEYDGEEFEDVFGSKGISTLMNRLATVYPARDEEFPLDSIEAACGIFNRMEEVGVNIGVKEYSEMYYSLIRKNDGEFKTDKSHEFSGYIVRLMNKIESE